jgi:hypothetical protein
MVDGSLYRYAAFTRRSVGATLRCAITALKSRFPSAPTPPLLRGIIVSGTAVPIGDSSNET